MGDLISRSEMLELLGDAEQEAYLEDECEAETIRKCIRLAKAVPTVDAVEVVRCKYCKHSIDDGWICGGPDLMCMPSHPSYPDNFCSYGERKDND